VEFFDENQYLYFSSVAENLIFGTPNKHEFANAHLPKNEYFLEFLKQADLNRTLLSLGAEMAKQTVDILGNLPPDSVFFEQSPIAAEELDGYKVLVEQLKKKKLHELTDTDRQMLLEISLRFTPGIHKIPPGFIKWCRCPRYWKHLFWRDVPYFARKLPAMILRQSHFTRWPNIFIHRRF
jgi:hypothetical protein